MGVLIATACDFSDFTAMHAFLCLTRVRLRICDLSFLGWLYRRERRCATPLVVIPFQLRSANYRVSKYMRISRSVPLQFSCPALRLSHKWLGLGGLEYTSW